MKKTKIIIPALAALCLSAAATVSGTVAWFASSRTSNVSASSIAVVNPEGSLTCSLTSIANTACDGSVVSMKKNTDNKVFRLRDASVQAEKNKTPTVYRATGVDDETHKGTGYASVAANYVYSETDAICYVAAWKMTFQMTGNSSDTYDITFNNTNSMLKDFSGSDEIFVAFRIAFITAEKCYVWAPKQGGKVTYVSGTSATDISEYSTEKITSDVVLGTIGTKDNTVSATKSLDVSCYMWFEGTDANCDENKLASGASLAATAALSIDAPLHTK